MKGYLMDRRLEKQLQFIIEVDKVKSIFRKSKLFHQDRFENDAEHSWHIALMAIVLAEYSNEAVDMLKVVKMLLIHDLVEIEAGDVLVYEKNAETEINEKKAAEKVFGLLPSDQHEELMGLWHEFEDLTTMEAKFAKALDRMEPIMQNIARNGETWNTYNITYQQVINTNSTISKGSNCLWGYIKAEIDKCYEAGVFKKENGA